jgi:hypothetical protein
VGKHRKALKQLNEAIHKPLVLNGNAHDGKYELTTESVRKFINDNLKKDYTVKSTGEKYFIAREGKKKIAGADETTLKSVAYLPGIIENAIFIAEEAPYKPKSKFSAYRYYLTPIEIDGIEYLARLVFGKGKKRKWEYYDHILHEIKKGSRTSTTIITHPWLAASLKNKDNTLERIMQVFFDRVAVDDTDPDLPP